MELEMQHGLQQKQNLSKKMLQSVHVLEMSMEETEDFLKEIIENNPMVDLDDDYLSRQKELKEQWQWEREHNYQIAETYAGEDQQDEKDEAPYLITEDTLEDYLMMQLVPLCKGKYKKDVFYYLVKSLNRKGYLDVDLSDLAGELKLTTDELKEYIERLQACEPAGIAARNIEECLVIQIIRMCPEETIAIRIIKECIELFAKRRFSSIANMLGCTVEEVQSAADIIYSLNPKPANGFAEMENLQYVHPDVFVVWHDDKPEIMVNESASARMTINPYYLKILETEKISKETISYIKNKVEQVKWAVKCVDQRNSTLQQVASAIVEWQELFFRFGSGRVVPMRLADIAPKVDMHVSTVSRAIKNKYVQCDYGLFPLSYFFSKTIGEGEDTPDDVKENLRKIIEQENKKKPLSDQKIANMLVEKGFQISRRTVAKYRSELGILGTSERKED